MTDDPCRDGHRFEARYDVGAPVYIPGPYGQTYWTGVGPTFQNMQAMSASRPATYVRDICVRCGKTIERGGKDG